MAVHRAKNKMTAMRAAAMARRNGFNASIFRSKDGWRVSVTRR